MPYKSEAQRRKFQELKAQGKISAETVAEFDKASEGKKLPERARAQTITVSKKYVKKI